MPKLDLREKTFPVHAELAGDIIKDPEVVVGFVTGRIYVVTAPRPLPGTWEWRGGGGYGYFYAALPVNPEESAIPEIYDWTLRQWRDNGAQQLLPFTEGEIWEKLLADLASEGISLEEALEMMPTAAEWRQTAAFRGLPGPRRLPTL